MAATYGEAEPTQAAGGQKPLSAIEGRTRAKFLLMVNPDCWVWDASAGEYLVDLQRLPLIPGVQGVDDTGNPAAAIAFHNQKGRRVLLTGDRLLRMPGDPSPFLRDGMYRARWVALTAERGVGRYAYGWAWEGYERVGQEVYWSEDRPMKQRFQRHLVTARLVDPMSLGIRGKMLKTAIDRYDRLVRRAKDESQYRARDAAKAHLDELLADFREHGGQFNGRRPVLTNERADVGEMDIDIQLPLDPDEEVAHG